MSKELKDKIERLEANIALENRFIAHQNTLLKQHDYSPKALPLLLAGGFIFGFAFARKKSLPQLMKSSTRLFLNSRKLYHSIKSFLPHLPI